MPENIHDGIPEKHIEESLNKLQEKLLAVLRRIPEAFILDEDLHALGVFDRRVLGTMIDGVQELAALYGEPIIQKVAKTGKIRWAGHVARMPDNNPGKLVLATDPVGTRRSAESTMGGSGGT